MNLKLTCFIVISILLLNTVSAQTSWVEYDKDIRLGKNLVFLANKMEQIKTDALDKKQYFLAGRCYDALIRIKDKKTEDTMFFKNSSILDSLIEDAKVTPELKSTIYVLKAKRIAQFEFNFFNRENKNLFTEVRKMSYKNRSKQSLDSIIEFCFTKAIELSKNFEEVKPYEVLWLSSDPFVFFCKPNNTDILYAEMINSFDFVRSSSSSSFDKNILKYTQTKFLFSLDSMEGIEKNLQYQMCLFGKWAKDSKLQTEKYYFIETLARKYFYKNIVQTDSVKKLYENYLIGLSESTFNEVRANSVYQLCLYWNTVGLKYNPNDYYSARYNDTKYFFEYKEYFKKAIDLLATNSKMLDSFSYLKNILLNMKEQINEKKLEIATNAKVLPNKAIVVNVTTKNVQKIYFKIVKIPAIKVFKEGLDTEAYYLQNKKEGILKQASLPVTDDYQTHKVKITLEGLQIGHYAILYAYEEIVKDKTIKANYIRITVSNIATINNDNRVFVLDRMTGFPIKNATIQTVKAATTYAPKIVGLPKKVNNEGWLNVSKENVDELIIANGIDTIVESFSIANNYLPDDIFDNEEHETLLDYYEHNLKLKIFTDRAIYRPGQKVYYKGILLLPNPYTGRWEVFNKQNTKFSSYQKLFNEEVKEFFKEEIDIYTKNPFGKSIDTFHVKPNEFGSFNGSFMISKDAALGEWEFDTDGIDFVDYYGNSFKVEEYKRPQFELSLEKPTNFLQLGDSFAAVVKVRSFAGANLKNVNLNYTVTASGDFPYYDSLQKKYVGKYEKIVLDDSDVVTNSEGLFVIKVNVKQLEKYKFTNDVQWNIYYKIDVEATDESGETHEEKTEIRLSNRPVKINYDLDNTLDRNNFPPLYVTTTSDFAGEMEKLVSVNIYKEKKAQVKPGLNDDYLYDYKEQNGQWIYIGNKEITDAVVKYYDTIYSSKLKTKSGEKFLFPKELLVAGKYEIEIICEENGKLLGKKWRSFQVFDQKMNALPNSNIAFHFMQLNAIQTQQKAKWIFGNKENKIYSIYHAQYFARKKKQPSIKYIYDTKYENKGINEWNFTMPNNAIDEILLTHIYIVNDEIQREERTIYVAKPVNEEPEIIIEQYRKRLEPAAKESFVVSIKTKSTTVLAELMTTMYDASLDKIEKHEWKIPQQSVWFRLSSSWEKDLNYGSNSSIFDNNYYKANISWYNKTEPLYWLNPLDYAYSELQSKSQYDTYNLQNGLTGRAAGVSIQQSSGLEEIVVVTATSKKLTSSSSIIIRGASSLSSTNVGLVILDGVLYEGDLSSINTSSITDAMVFKGADGVAIYGSRAAEGVLIISTKGKIVLPKTEEPPLVIRKNFSETAFFYPNIYADADGFYKIEFTMPESVTEWKWKLLAHTKKAKFMYAERNIVTQLPMMVQPNMPRFLYQGDKIVLQTRVTNLDTTNLEGRMNCSIEDAVTGEDLTASIIAKNQQAFSVLQKTNSNVAYEMNIPENLLHPLKIKITARAGSFADGEEHTIPILSKKILVSQNVGFVLVNSKDSSITTPAMPADATPFAIGLYITPKPQAAMINALPYLAFYKYGCAEQTFNKLLAHSIANTILRTDTITQKTMVNAKAKETENTKKDVLPDELSEETMPWLQLGNATALNQKNLLKLFDTLSGNLQIEKYLNDIKDLQNADGGITWFKGGESSKYISNYILAGFAKLTKENLLFFKTSTARAAFETFIPSLIRFCDASFVDTINYRGDDLSYIFARSLWVKDYPIPNVNINRIEDLLGRFWLQLDKYTLNRQAMLIISSMKYAATDNVFYKKALEQLESIRQLAITDNVNGIRWKDIADTDDLTSNSEETVTHLAEAFEQTGSSKETIDGIIKWLLNAKQDHNWSTTKSTASVVGLLYRNQPTVVGIPVNLYSSINNTNLAVSDDLLSGSLFSSTTLQKFPSTVSIKKSSEFKANAGLNYFYFTANPPIITNDNALKISKQLFFLNKQNEWELLNESTILKIADKVKTIITINAPKQLKFVFIDEKRAATLEPVDAISEYEYGKGFGYYKSVRDIGYQFFAEQIPSGISTIEYETVVAKEGRFSSGPTAMQCMYKPEVRAYGTGVILLVK